MYRLTYKADLPFNYKSSSGIIYCDIKDGDNAGNYELHKIDGINVTSSFQLEFILDKKSINDKVDLELYFNENSKNISYNLVPYYKNYLFIYISLIVGLAFWVSGIVILLKKAQNISAHLMFRIFLIFSCAIMTSPGPVLNQSDWMGYIIKNLHVLSYIFGAGAFLHFTFIFPQNIKFKIYHTIFLYTTLTVIAVIDLYYLQKTLIYTNSSYLKLFDNFWDLTQIILLISFVTGTLRLYLVYRKLQSDSDKRKILWIFWGLSAGVFPFLIFWVIPVTTGLPVLIPEEVLLAFLVFVPLSFTTAVIKYHVFDIELVIKRSIVYFAASAVIAVIYFILVLFLYKVAELLIRNPSTIVSVIVVLSIALIFNPLKTFIQNFVDRKFFRQSYQLDLVMSDTVKIIDYCSSLPEFGNTIIKQVSELIPVDKIAVLLRTESGQRLYVLAHKNLEMIVPYINAFRVNQLKVDFTKIIALYEDIEPGLIIDDNLQKVMERWGLSLVVPMRMQSDFLVGALVLGKKLSGIRYTHNDIKLLNMLATSSAIAINRLQLKDSLIKQDFENEKLKELNELKSFFVSGVSHELQTPLSSIQMFAETLLSGKITDEHKKKTYLETIIEETNRLSRMIKNTLKTTKQEYSSTENFEEVNLTEILDYVITSLEYLFKKSSIKLNYNKNESNIYVLGNSDEIASAVMNILSNAAKYSGFYKQVDLSLGIKDDQAIVAVRDYGMGISPDEQNSIFDPFYRTKNENKNDTGGWGFGLAFVKYIMDKHNGEVLVESKLNEGSTFKLIFKTINKIS